MRFEQAGREHKATGDLFVLSANAIYSLAILIDPGMGGRLTGHGLHESYGAHPEVFLDEIDSFDAL